MLYLRRAAAPEYYLAPDTPTVDGELEAWYGGEASKIMGLSEFRELGFLRLAKGLNPETGSQLTARLKENRKAADDLTVTVPKCVSVLIEVSQDERVKAALWEANEFVMREFEKKVKVRVRKGGVYQDRETGNIAYASFYHGTTRPITDRRSSAHFQSGGVEFLASAANDNQPDPHSHIHNYVFNVSFDREEKAWKALKRHHFDLPRLEKSFHERLATNLRAIGYDAAVVPNGKATMLELRGFPGDVEKVYNRRQDAVKEVELERPYLNEQGNAAFNKKMGAAKARLSQVTREVKASSGLTRTGLHRWWVGRLSGEQFGKLVDYVDASRLSVTFDRFKARVKRHAGKLRQAVVQETERSYDRGIDR